ncbi:MAG: GTPase domain-containing protein [Candidatus Thorarchaeota archaeon]
MIIKAGILTTRLNLVQTVRYFSYDIPHESLIELVASSLDVASEPCEEPVKSLVLITWVSPEGAKLKVAIARIRRGFIFIVADELEHDESLQAKVSSIAQGFPTIVGKRSLTRLNLRTRKALRVFLNEQVLDYVRFALFGYPKAGKTTLFALTTQERAVVEYLPTIKPAVAPNAKLYQALLELEDLSKANEWFLVANRIVTIYDLPGTPNHWLRWSAYLKRADVGVLVLRSTRRGVIQARSLLRELKHKLPKTVIAIANYQDFSGALSPEAISRTLGITTYGMVGTDLDRMEQLRDLFKTVAITKLQLATTRS